MKAHENLQKLEEEKTPLVKTTFELRREKSNCDRMLGAQFSEDT